MTEQHATILILGGYGTFGGRLARLLADEPRLTLIIAGRSLAKAEAFCAQAQVHAELKPLAFDLDGDVESQLAAAAPDIVVDAAGPFQSYGDPYRIVRAAIKLGINYLDLADASAFVKGIAQFDGLAKSCGVFVLAGVSSFPVLTAAVVRALSHDMARVEKVTGGIAPSPYAGVGLNVVRAIASYAGKPLAMADGSTRSALVDTLRYTIAPPGRLPLYPVLFSLVDVPDLKVLPELWPDLKSVWMGAGPVPEILHRVLNAIALLVRYGIVSSLSPLAPLMFRAINVLRWGEHRGGMFVAVRGVGGRGDVIERSWHLLAEGDDGPFIPSMAVEAIVRKILGSAIPAPGARAATRALEVADYEALFARRKIFTGVRDQSPADAPLYLRMLGSAFDSLPPALRVMHDLRRPFIAQGRARVDRGTGILARIVASIFRFPNAGDDVPVTVSFEVSNRRERWQRNFAGRQFASTQEQGRGRFDGLICERFGPFNFGLAPVIDAGRLNLVVRRWSFFGVPMPLSWAPVGTAYERVENDRFQFFVEIAHPLAGVIVRYQGWLVPSASENVLM